MKKIYLPLILSVVFYSANCQIINTVAGNGGTTYSGSGGQATAASIYVPEAAQPDALGDFYISEFQNNIDTKVSATGIINPFAGDAVSGFSGDGGQATAAQIAGTYGIAYDALGNFYVCDFNNARLRKVSPTGIISEVAGNGVSGYGGDGGQATAAELNWPESVICDASNNVYVCDWMNNRVRKITVATGIITTVIGTGTASFSGDGGQATAAEIDGPMDLGFDAAGNMYLADGYNNRIRKVVIATGIINTIAGTGVGTYSGDGGQATAAGLGFPRGVCVNAANGNIYIADEDENRVRLVTVSTGIITTYAGNGTAAFSGDGGQATAAEIYYPCKIRLDASGNGYICDLENYRVRKVGSVPLPITLLDFTAVYNYTNNVVNLEWSTASEINNKYFTIERSTDGINFTELAEVNGAGNSSQTNYYMATDDNPVPGVDYYRLKQTDFDGHFVYCKVIPVDVTSAAFTVFPNPANTSVNIEYTAAQEDAGPAVIKIYSLMGQLISTHNVNAQAGTNTFQLDVSYLKEGLCLLVFNNGSKQFTSKLVISGH